MSDDANYDLKNKSDIPKITAPDINYSPSPIKNKDVKIGLIACGGITKSHLQAYKSLGLDVVALCDPNRANAEARQEEFYPSADIYEDYKELLARDDISIVDIALHPDPRGPIIEAALNAGKHVLSQKPFVLDLDYGKKLVDLADAKGLRLAVNQNGRWAPYVRYITKVVQENRIGEIHNVSIRMNWDHTWVQGTGFESIHHLILYDFAIHWIDMTRLWMGDKEAKQAFASTACVPEQEIVAPMTANISYNFEQGIANLLFDGHSTHGQMENIHVVGSKGAIHCSGKVCNANNIHLITDEGECYPELEGTWFDEGFQGTMAELISAIDEDREPENSGRGNLKSLELAFAAIESADTGKQVVPGSVRTLGSTCKQVL